MKNIKVIVLEVGKKAEIRTIVNSLETLQKTVGGWLELVHLDRNGRPEQRRVAILVDEEGYLKQLPFNIRLAGLDIVGTIVISGIRNGEFISLTKAQLRDIKELLGERGEDIES